MEPFSVLKEKYNNIRFDLYPNEKTKTVFLSGFIVPVNLRNTGIGSSFMNDLISIADTNEYKIILTPSDSYGGSVRRLKEFYKRFGFIENKGKNRDFSHKEDMYRNPKMSQDRIELNEEICRINTIIKSLI